MTDEDGRMSGPEHFREAESLLGYVYCGADRDGAPLADHEVPTILARAQIHATLAQAAATAMETVSQFMGLVRPDSLGDDEVITQWAKVTGWSTIVGATHFPSEREPF